jgi:hypothetical protein
MATHFAYRIGFTTTQPYNNLMLSLGSVVTANEQEDASIPPPWDASIPGIKMVPLVEAVRPIGSGFPRPYPVNIWGETPHAAMANELTVLAKMGGASDFITVHTVVGESGQGIVALVKKTGRGQPRGDRPCLCRDALRGTRHHRAGEGGGKDVRRRRRHDDAR